MIRFLIHVVVVALGLWLSWKFVPGIGFNSLQTLVIAALLLGVANAIVRPILVILTFPLTVITLGLWLIVINAAMIGLVAYFLNGFRVRDFIAAFLCWLVVTVVSWVAGWFTGK
jgi:putative membrane protein